MTLADGFAAAGVASGIKGSGDLDLALVIATSGAVPTAGVFTRNRARAAPVVISSRRLLATRRARAVLLNSGCANAGTGDEGWAAVETTTAAVATALKTESAEVLACSTGPIGIQLPTEQVIDALPRLLARARAEGGEDAALAILTTDSHPKQVRIASGNFTVGGFAKGAAMLRPDMATMLCVLTTDADADPETLQRVLTHAVEVTFNCLNVDGCESTNDTALLLASGRSGPVNEDELAVAVERACRDLAQAMAADAEGASKVVRIRVRGASDFITARGVARAIADSALARASFYGADPNWGRVLAAAGTCPVEVRSIAYEDVLVYDENRPQTFDDAALAARLKSDFAIEVVVAGGDSGCEVITTDLTPEYVRFNGERS